MKLSGGYEFLNGTFREPALFAVTGIGEMGGRVVRSLRNFASRGVLLQELPVASVRYGEIDEARLFRSGIWIVAVDLGEPVDALVPFVREIRRHERQAAVLAVLPDGRENRERRRRAEEMLRDLAGEASMLSVTDAERWCGLAPQEVRERTERLLREQAVDFMETALVPGLIHLDFGDLKYFVHAAPPHTIYLSGRGTGAQRMRRATEELLRDAAELFPDRQPFSGGYVMIRYGGETPVLKEVSEALEALFSVFGEESSRMWGIQPSDDGLSDAVRIFMFAKTVRTAEG